MYVGSLRIYPVKSTRGQSIEAADVERSGLAGDRRWAVHDRQGRCLTARTHPRLLSVAARPRTSTGLRLHAFEYEPLDVAEPVDGRSVTTNVSRLGYVVDAGDPAAEWFSELLDEPVRLVWQDDPAHRRVSTDHGGRDHDPLSLADAGPLLLTTSQSLQRLGSWLTEVGSALSELTERMRPNVVVDDVDEAFAEDRWRRVRIGDLDYRFADHCDRCVLTTVDPVALTRGPEPIRTLSRHRKVNGKVWFGVWLIPESRGRIRVGDHVVAQS